jgi:hypothetical protein
VQNRQGLEAVDRFIGLLVFMRVDFDLLDVFAADPVDLCYVWSMAITFNVQHKARAVGGSALGVDTSAMHSLGLSYVSTRLLQKREGDVRVLA